MTGSWTTFVPPSSAGSFAPETMLLLTDGSVLIHQSGGANWLRLTPDGGGNYATGSWSGLLPMSEARQFFSSGVLRDGRVFVVGGEDSSSGGDDPTAEIFDPRLNSWSPLNKPSSVSFIQGDASGCVLADGRVLFGNLNPANATFKTAVWDPVGDTWTPAGTHFGQLAADTKQTNCNEETWTLLRDGSVLTVSVHKPPTSERYLPWDDEWVSAGNTPTQLPLTTIVDPQGNKVPVFEIGPAILLPDGKLFAIGATGQTAVYSPAVVGRDPFLRQGGWTLGPSFPPDTSAGAIWPTLTVSDGPAVLQTNGNVLCVAGSLYEFAGPPLDYFSQNMEFFEYFPATNKLVPLPTPPFSPANAPNTWDARFLLLPTAQVLLTTESGTIWLYTPDAATNTPSSAWRPTITACPETLALGHGYTISGKQLNGLSQAVSYGDDSQAATNYPLVRLTNGEGTVKYLPTSNFSTMGVATGDITVTADFDVSESLAVGPWSLSVIANGIASEAVAVEVVEAAIDCQQLLANLDELAAHHGPKLTVDQATTVRSQLTTCHLEHQLTDAQYARGLRDLSEVSALSAPAEPSPAG